MYANRQATLGWSWNPVDWVEGGINLLTHGGGSSNIPSNNGWAKLLTLPNNSTFNVQTLQARGATGNDIDDLATINDWTTAVKAEGGVPTRMPSGQANAGELAERFTGPGTNTPDASPPFEYGLAPANVLAADHRLAAKLQDQVDALVPADTAMGLLGTVQKYAGYAAIGLGAVIVLPLLVDLIRPRAR